jgi:membrane protease YdiL (CAAX protease family)
VNSGNDAPGWGIPGLGASSSPVRWGLGDFFLAWVVGIIGATIAILPFGTENGTVPVSGLVASMLGQSAASLAYLELISRRKGRGSLAADFGLSVRARDAVWILVGLGTSLALGLILLPISLSAGDDAGQEVVRQFQKSQGTVEILFAIGVVVVAPVIEELLYRGLLLRSLLRKMSPVAAIFVSGVTFGAVHVVLDPGAYVALPALAAMGVISGILAVRSGDLSRSIFFHAGFNLLTTVQIIAVAVPALLPL